MQLCASYCKWHIIKLNQLLAQARTVTPLSDLRRQNPGGIWALARGELGSAPACAGSKA